MQDEDRDAFQNSKTKEKELYGGIWRVSTGCIEMGLLGGMTAEAFFTAYTALLA